MPITPPRLREGQEPDPRFTLANERTFLAWNRTALGSVVAGLAVSHLLAPDDGAVGAKVAGTVLMIVGAVISVLSFRTWIRAQHALRTGQPLPHTVAIPLVALATAGVGLFAAAFSLW